MAHTDISTDGHGDSMTNSAQWGRVGKNKQNRTDRKTYRHTNRKKDTQKDKKLKVSCMPTLFLFVFSVIQKLK